MDNTFFFILLLLAIIILYISGNPNFWKLIRKNPEFSFYWFTNQKDIWLVYGYGDNDDEVLDEGNWDGPFYIMDPFGNRTKIYGKIGKYEKAQKDFCEKYDKVLNEYQLQKKEAEKRKYSRRTIQKAIHNSLASRIESHFIKKDTSQEEE